MALNLSNHIDTEGAAALADLGFALPNSFAPPNAGLVPALLDQSLDCIKLIGLDGCVQYMNANGLCAMEIDQLGHVVGEPWSSLWPAEAQATIERAIKGADQGPVRFDAFCPTVKGSPRWWDVSLSRVEDQQGGWAGYLAVSRDVTEARLAKEVAEVSTAEMRHRLRNSYAMVAGLLSALARGRPEREQFVEEVAERLSALGVAQTMFVAQEHAPCDVHVLLPALLEPFAHPECPIHIDDIPHTVIDQGQADALALIFGELAVNSTKHGALTSSGDIAVRAHIADGDLVIRWSERSPRAVGAHARKDGEGLRLIQRIVGARRGTLKIEWVENGLDAIIALKLLKP